MAMPAKKSTSRKSSKKSTKKSTKKSAKRAAKKPAKRKTTRKSAPKVVTNTVTERVIVEKPVYHEPTEEHRVFSHVMYILFLVSGAVAAYYTYSMWMSTQTFAAGDVFDLSSDRYLPVKALVMIGWAFLFKTFAHRIHTPHH